MSKHELSLSANRIKLKVLFDSFKDAKLQENGGFNIEKFQKCRNDTSFINGSTGQNAMKGAKVPIGLILKPIFKQPKSF